MIDEYLKNLEAEIEEALSKYENEIGLSPNYKVEEPKCLSLSLEEIRKKTPEQLSEFIYEINKYSIYIQRILNNNKAWERWCKSKLDELTAHYIPEVNGQYGFNERILMARHNPTICKKLNQFMREIGMKIDRLYTIPNDLKVMSDSIKDLKFSMIRREKDYARE